jgi:hypothetical protein
MSAIVALSDFRNAWPTVRDQGARPTCLAMAVSDAHMLAQSKRDLLSTEYLFARGLGYLGGSGGSSGLTVVATQKALTNDGQPHETEWPYCLTGPVAPTGSCSERWFGSLKRFTSIDEPTIRQNLERSVPVLLVLRLTHAFYVLNEPWVIPADGSGLALHAVVAVGLGSDNSHRYVLIRNSWGSDWADRGHAWLAWDYLVDKLMEWCVVESTGGACERS